MTGRASSSLKSAEGFHGIGRRVACLTRVPLGYSRTLSAVGSGGGDVSPRSLLSVKLLDRLSIRKRYLISP